MLRFEAQRKLGRTLSVREAAEGITEKMRSIAAIQGMEDAADIEIGRQRLTVIELGDAAVVKGLEMLAIAEYYSEVLGRRVGFSELMEIDPNNKWVPASAAA